MLGLPPREGRPTPSYAHVRLSTTQPLVQFAEPEVPRRDEGVVPVDEAHPPRVKLWLELGTETKSGAWERRMDETLASELARDLARRGNIDRNFSLYADHVYGNFTGDDGANFMVQHVQPNVMNIDYDLSRPRDGDREGAAANLLLEAEEAGEDLLNTVAAYNIDLVKHLLETGGDLGDGGEGAATVAMNLIAGWPGEKARSFLAAYFTSKKAQREKFAALLARCRWREVYTYLSTNDDVPADVRVELVNAALEGFDPQGTYDLGEDVCDFVIENYRSMAVFSGGPALTQTPDAELEAHPSERLPERLDEILRRCKVVLPELKPLREDIRKLVVGGNRYQLTADNLRTALDLEPTDAVPLDTVIDSEVGNETVYAHCLANLSGYLTAVENDNWTGHAVNAPETLAQVLDDVVEHWSDEQITENEQAPDSTEVAALLTQTSPHARLSSLREVPKVTWKALAAAKLFRASLANIEAYRTHVGSVDDHASGLLQEAGTVHVDETGDTTDSDGQEYSREPAAIAILNAAEMPSPAKVWLANALAPTTPLPVDKIEAGPNDLFARLIRNGFVEDTEPTFDRLRVWGWAALGPAITVSDSITSFLNPGLLEGMVGAALTDPETATRIADQVLADVDGYVPTDDWDALRAVVSYADTHDVALTPQTVARIARVGQNERDLDVRGILRLLSATSPVATPADIVETFRYLGDPYNLIAETGRKFDVDYDELHDNLLRVLDSADLISRGTPRVPKKRYSVTVK